MTRQKTTFSFSVFQLALGISLLIIFLFGLSSIVEELAMTGASMKALHLFFLARGILVSFIVSGWVAWYLISKPFVVPTFNVGMEQMIVPSPVDWVQRSREQVLWLIRLRWLAVIAIVFLIIFVHQAHLLPIDVLPYLFGWLFLLGCMNIFYTIRAPVSHKPYRLLVIQILADLIILTALLNASGGFENPLFIVYAFHVVIGGIVLRERDAYLITFVTIACLAVLGFGELKGILPHYTLKIFPHEGAYHSIHAAHDPFFVVATFLSLTWVLLCTVYFVRLVMKQLEKSESRLIHVMRLLTQEREQLKTVVNSVGIGFILMDPSLKILWFNDKVRDWFGWDENRLNQRCGCLSSKQDDDKKSSSGCLAEEVLRENRSLEREQILFDKSGKKRFYRTAVSVISNEKGVIMNLVELVQDITEVKVLEAEAMQKQKMTTLGYLAAMTTHEIGNPLSSICARLQLMKDNLTASDNNREFFEHSIILLQEQINRIGRIVNQISQFSKRSRDEWDLVSLNDVIFQVVDILKMDRRFQDVEMKINLATNLPLVKGNKDQLIQLFLNLGINAAEAMEGRGTFTIKSNVEGNLVIVTFRDSGPGLTDEIRANLFSPFFSTKSNGTGLGLFICDNIIRKHGGRIDVSGVLGTGTCFSLKIPSACGKLDTQKIGAEILK